MLDARLRPHHGLHLRLGAFVPVVAAFGARFQCGLAGGEQQVQRADDVAHLALGVKDQAAAAGEVGARAIHAEEIRKAIEEPVSRIIEAVKSTLDTCPPELSGDIMDRGIVLTGGGALLHGLDERLRHETGIAVNIAENPLHAVVMGTGRCIEEFEALEKVLISEPRR